MVQCNISGLRKCCSATIVTVCECCTATVVTVCECCTATVVTVGRVNVAAQHQLRCVSIAWVWVLLCIGGWAVPTKRCSRPPVRSPGARRSTAQPGERAARRNQASAQHGATRRARSTAAHVVSVASAQHSVELPVGPVTSTCFVC